MESRTEQGDFQRWRRLMPVCFDAISGNVLEQRRAVIRLGKRRQHADPPHLARLLRARRERPRGCRATDQRDELAPLQLIELHAVPSTRTGFCMISNWQSYRSGRVTLQLRRFD
jgi:hypothetical protein